MLRARERVPGGVVGEAMARSAATEAREARAAAAAAGDPDEHAANLVTRGYLPGMLSQLSMRLADTEAEIADEEAKISKTARRDEWVARNVALGRISGADVARMQAAADEGDPETVARLQRRAASLRRQIAEASEAVRPPEARARDAVEEAGRRAQAVLSEVAQLLAEEDAAASRARARLTSERSAFYAARGGRPLVSSGGAGEG
jgi:hypothetical protein